ncbi:MAG: hypothetical protein WC875_03110 [Candidatus Absconditabacterales bacterium]
MPNIVGGDQFHPAYKPRQLEKNEVLVDSVLYTITIKRNKVTITYEKVDGQSGYESEANAPRRVKNRIKKLKGGK